MRELFAEHLAKIGGKPADPAAGEWTLKDFIRLSDKKEGWARKLIRKMVAKKSAEVLRVYRNQKVYRFTDAKA